MDANIAGSKENLVRLFWQEIDIRYTTGKTCLYHTGEAVCECPKTLAELKRVMNGSVPACSKDVCPVRNVLHEVMG